MPAGNTPEEWFYSIPKITRNWFVAAVASTFLTTMQFVDPYSLVFWPEKIWSNFEVWRIFTSAIYFGPLGLPFAFNLYFLVKYSAEYEKNPYSTTPGAVVGGTPDYAFTLLFNLLVHVPIAYYLGLPVLSGSLVFSVLYLWSRQHATQQMNFWGIPFKGIHLPWVLMAATTLMGGSPVKDLVGVGVGHTFYFFAQVLPLKTGKNYLSTPAFVIQLCDYFTGEHTTYRTTTGTTRVDPRPTRTGGHSWGSGRALGAE